MIAVVQRVSHACVSVDGDVMASIQRGILALIGVADGDSDEDVRWMADKIANLRIFEDSAGKMNLSVLDVGGHVLVVSQFTLLADVRRGRRPGFDAAAKPEEAQGKYLQLITELRKHDCKVQSGVFGADMAVNLTNDGPVTIILPSPHSQQKN